MIWEMTWKIPWGLTLDSRRVEACSVWLCLAVHLRNAIHVRCRRQRAPLIASVLTLGCAPIVILDKPHKFLKLRPVKV